MKFTLLLSFICFFTFSASSQLSEIDISDYVLPEIHLKKSNINFSFNGDAEDYYYYRSPSHNNVDELNASLGGSLYYGWSNYMNTPKWQKFNYININTSPSLSLENRIENEEEIREKDVRAYLNLSTISSCKYFYQPLRFLEFGAELYSSNNYVFSILKNPHYTAKSHYFRFKQSVSPDFLIGFGRVEHVGHAWHAVRILSDLDKIGGLARAPEKDDVMALATHISQRKYTRFFDSRLKMIEDIESLDEKLQALMLVDKKGAAYYSSLYDMWRYGQNAQRKSGQSIAFGLDTYLAMENALYNDNIFSAISYAAGLKLKHNYHKPINLKWQFDIENEARVLRGSLNYFDVENEDDSSYWYYSFNSSIAMNWYPNTRTQFSSNFYAFVGNHESYFFERYLVTNDATGFYARINWSNSLYYYLSPRARIYGDLDLSYLYTKEEFRDPFYLDYLNKRFNVGFNIGFSYILF